MINGTEINHPFSLARLILNQTYLLGVVTMKYSARIWLLSIYVASPASSPSFTIPQSPAGDALSIIGNTGNTDDTGLPVEWKAPYVLLNDQLSGEIKNDTNK